MREADSSSTSTTGANWTATVLLVEAMALARAWLAEGQVHEARHVLQTALTSTQGQVRRENAALNATAWMLLIEVVEKAQVAQAAAQAFEVATFMGQCDLHFVDEADSTWDDDAPGSVGNTTSVCHNKMGVDGYEDSSTSTTRCGRQEQGPELVHPSSWPQATAARCAVCRRRFQHVLSRRVLRRRACCRCCGQAVCEDDLCEISGRGRCCEVEASLAPSVGQSWSHSVVQVSTRSEYHSQSESISESRGGSSSRSNSKSKSRSFRTTIDCLQEVF